LLDLFNSSGVGELEQDGTRIRIRKAGEAPEYVVSPSSGGQETAAPPAAAATGLGTAHASPQAVADAGTELVKSTIVGTYYDASSPGAPPFVKVGDSVEPGQVLCIIESMKLMNEIEAETAGVVAAKLVENGRPVEYGEALFSIRPRSPPGLFSNMLQKILIANRGDRRARHLRLQGPGDSHRGDLLEADRHSLHTRFADEAICVGPAAAPAAIWTFPL
jgi:acetyl-CoA carboxylase biotin carboxyl carrier protein